MKASFDETASDATQVTIDGGLPPEMQMYFLEGPPSLRREKKNGNDLLTFECH